MIYWSQVRLKPRNYIAAALAFKFDNIVSVTFHIGRFMCIKKELSVRLYFLTHAISLHGI